MTVVDIMPVIFLKIVTVFVFFEIWMHTLTILYIN